MTPKIWTDPEYMNRSKINKEIELVIKKKKSPKRNPRSDDYPGKFYQNNSRKINTNPSKINTTLPKFRREEKILQLIL